MYMNIRWNHDHEYFQRMIEWEQRIADEIGPVKQEMNTRSSNEDEVVGALITNLQDFLDDGSSSDGSSMPPLRDGGISDSS